MPRLRELAVRLLQNGTVTAPDLAAVDLDALIHELHVYHAELVIQKNELEVAQAEGERARSETAQLFQYAPVGILFLDRRGQIREANQAAARVLGATAQVLRGKPFTAFLAADGHAEFHRRLAAVLGDGDRCAFEAVCARPLAGAFPAHITMEWWAMSAPGNPVAAVAVHDVTDRKRAEETLLLRDRAITAASQGIVICDYLAPDLPMTYVSPGFERMTGYRAAEVLGRNCRLLQGPDTDPAAVANLRAALTAGQPHTAEVLNYRQDGTPFWSHLSVSPVHDDAGRVTHYVGVQTDVTARRKLEDQFRHVQKMEAIGRLAGGVAHDFNNLLTIINGYSEMLLAGDLLSGPAAELVGEIRKAGERSAGLTRQLLTFSRQEVLQPRDLSLNAVLADAESLLRRLIGEDVWLSTRLHPAAGAVRADQGQLEQLLFNLAVNARDAMPAGGRLTIDTGLVEADERFAQARPGLRPGPHAVLTVADTGCGMTEEVKGRIFEPFFTTKGLGRGTGLGLATVYGIVRSCDGFIEVDSAPGAGAAFRIYLPSAGPGRSAGADASGGHRSPPGTETVLLTEDEPGVRALARASLRACGYDVLVAADGYEAERIVATHPGPIHLLVTDVVMPGMGGRQLAERVRARDPGIKLLFMSGYTDDEIVRHGVLKEEVPFLQKPFTPFGLGTKVREVLDRPHPPGEPTATAARPPDRIS